MFAFLIVSSLCNALKIQAKNANAIFKQSPVTIILFRERITPNSKEIISIFDKLASKYEPDIKFYFSEDKKFAQQYNAVFPLRIGIFRENNFAGFYDKKWTYENLDVLCHELLNVEYKTINSAFELYRFQSFEPVNLIITDPSLSKKASSIISQYGGLLQVGIVTNEELIKELNLPKVQICHPLNEMFYNLTDVDPKTISQYLIPKYLYIENEMILGEQSKIKNSLVVLYDPKDPKHVHEVCQNFEIAEQNFRGNISLQMIDIFLARSYVEEFSIVSYSNPIYIYIFNNLKGETKPTVLQKLNPKQEEMIAWLNLVILHIKPQRENRIKLPVLHANEFIEKVLNPKKDVFLFVANPHMKKYEEGYDNMEIIARLFANYTDRIEIYEFDITREHVEGLTLPTTKDPQISIWPASEEPDGSTFTALAQVPVLLDRIVQLCKSEFTDDELKAMAAILEQELM